MDDMNISTSLSWPPFTVSPSPSNEIASLPAQQFANFLWTVASILLVLFGTIGNALSFLVMSRPTIKKTVTSLLLRVLAVVDTSVLWSGYFIDWVLIVFGFDLRLLSEFCCKLQHVMFYWTFHCSAWILVLVTTERFISVVFPLNARKLITKRRMIITIVTIMSLLFLLNAHFFWTQKLMLWDDDQRSCINDVDRYEFWLDHAWPWIDLTVYSIIPFLIICTGNIAITTRVLMSRRKAAGGAAASSNASAEKSSQMTSMTTTLVCVSLIFLVTTLPYPFYVLVKKYARDSVIDINLHTKDDLAWALVNFAAYTNNAVNFPLYCLSSRLFRGELKAMLRTRKVGPVSNANNSVV